MLVKVNEYVAEITELETYYSFEKEFRSLNGRESRMQMTKTNLKWKLEVVGVIDFECVVHFDKLSTAKAWFTKEAKRWPIPSRM